MDEKRGTPVAEASDDEPQSSDALACVGKCHPKSNPGPQFSDSNSEAHAPYEVAAPRGHLVAMGGRTRLFGPDGARIMARAVVRRLEDARKPEARPGPQWVPAATARPATSSERPGLPARRAGRTAPAHQAGHTVPAVGKS
jgi:hypothetical protein